MFDAVLDRAAAPRGRLGTGTVLSVTTHAILIAGAIALSAQPAAQSTDDVPVFFYAAPPPPAPPPPPLARRAQAPATETPKQRPKLREDTVYDTKEPPKDQRSEPAPQEETAGSDEGVEDGSPDGDKNGSPDGMSGGDPNAVPRDRPPPATPPRPSTVVLPFGAEMTRPSRVAGRDPVYTREAREARIEGVSLVRCTIQIDGAVTHCRMIKSLPHMDKAILDALATWRMTPVTLQGRPVAVDYFIPVRLALQ